MESVRLVVLFVVIGLTTAEVTESPVTVNSTMAVNSTPGGSASTLSTDVNTTSSATTTSVIGTTPTQVSVLSTMISSTGPSSNTPGVNVTTPTPATLPPSTENPALPSSSSALSSANLSTTESADHNEGHHVPTLSTLGSSSEAAAMATETTMSPTDTTGRPMALPSVSHNKTNSSHKQSKNGHNSGICVVLTSWLLATVAFVCLM